MFKEEVEDYNFDRIINLDDSKFNKFIDQKIELQPNIITRRIQIEHGLLYTSSVIDRDLWWAYGAFHNPDDFIGHRIDEGVTVATEITIAIPRNEMVRGLTMSTGNAKLADFLGLLTLVANESYYYDIEIRNMCPDELDDKGKSKFLKPGIHSDFQYYYNALNTPPAKRIDFQLSAGAGNARIPCDTLYIESSPEIP